MAITDEIPKSRVTLTYRTKVQGTPEEVVLPFRMLIMGDLSGGTSKDRALELDKRQFRRLDGKNLDEVIKDMNISLSLTVANRVDPSKAEEMGVTLPITAIKSFSPAEIAKHVPKIRSLLLLKKLLLEVQSNIDNRKDFRKLLRQLAADKTAVEGMLKELEGYEDFKLPALPKSGEAGDKSES